MRRLLPLLLALIALCLTACGDEEEPPAAEQPKPKAVRPGDKLAALATRELKANGGFKRWSVRRIGAVSDDDILVYTDLPRGSASRRAAAGICRSLRNPVSTRFKVDSIDVIDRRGKIKDCKPE